MFIIVQIIILLVFLFIMREANKYFNGNYWVELSKFLDKRDEAIIKRLRENKDYKIGK